MTVTDMILNVDELIVPLGLPEVILRPQIPETEGAIRRFVAAEHPSFSQYYAHPSSETDIYAVIQNDQMVGSVLIQRQPGAADTAEDGGIACLIVANGQRGRQLGSAAIVACCTELRLQGFQRVIAEWVASIELYSRLGFQIWKTREIDPEST